MAFLVIAIIAIVTAVLQILFFTNNCYTTYFNEETGRSDVKNAHIEMMVFVPMLISVGSMLASFYMTWNPINKFIFYVVLRSAIQENFFLGAINMLLLAIPPLIYTTIVSFTSLILHENKMEKRRQIIDGYYKRIINKSILLAERQNRLWPKEQEELFGEIKYHKPAIRYIDRNGVRIPSPKDDEEEFIPDDAVKVFFSDIEIEILKERNKAEKRLSN